MIRRRPLIVVALLLAAVAAVDVDARTQRCGRIVAIGDLHGGYDTFVTMLRETQLVDEELRLRDDESCLVQTGDIVDRGARSREILDLLIQLESQAPDRVTVLLGNHEVMTLAGDLRYVHPGEITAFATEETAAERDAAFDVYRKRQPNPLLTPEQARQLFEELFPRGWFARQRAFAPGGRYGDWLMDRPIAARIGKTVFVHGGLRVVDAESGVSSLNRRARQELSRYFELRAQLNAAGWVDRMVDFQESFRTVMGRHQIQGPALGGPGDGALLEVAGAYLAIARALIFDPAGPLWNRYLAEGDAQQVEPELNRVLELLDARRIVIGHTTQTDHQIKLRLGARVALIDTGSGPAYGNRPGALELRPSGSITAIYPSGRVPLSGNASSDTEIEVFLRKGRIVEIKDIGVGITKPQKAVLEYAGSSRRAAFKAVDIRKKNEITRFEGGVKMGFNDRYIYERAAYLVDRALGMGMVPVAVIREVGGETGAMIDWVENAITEAERREGEGADIDLPRLFLQRDIMTVFDTLIANDDRNLGNQLITPADDTLHLIDHTRAFRLGGQLPKGFDKRTISLPRWLFDALLALDEDALRQELKGVLSRAQIKAMFSRRDRLVRHIERQRKTLGDAVTFHPEENVDESVREEAAGV